MYVDFDDSEDFVQTLKITAVKKLVWNEVIFVEDDAELEKLIGKEGISLVWKPL